MSRYLDLADTLGSRIEQGLYEAGCRLPSVRALSTEHGVSLTTVQQAYRWLEMSGLAEARPRSGWYVPMVRPAPGLPRMGKPNLRPIDVSDWGQVQDLLELEREGETVQLGRGMPDVESPSLRPLRAALARESRRAGAASLHYNDMQGVPALREQLSRLAVDAGYRAAPEALIVTTGCQEALSCAVRALCAPGDIVAVASPSYHGMMQILKEAGVQAFEIPSDPVQGISLEALELALERWPVKAIQVIPNASNPLGYTMPEHRGRGLIRLAQRFDVPIIEDDIYGDLAYGWPRPHALKALDEDGRVLLCSSFSKTLAPGLRVGWIAPGRYFDKVLRMKYTSSGPTAPLPQIAVAEFLRKGHYPAHLRRMRRQYQRQRDVMAEWVRRHFPAGTRISHPQGGFTLWIELPESFDTHALDPMLRENGIVIAHGDIFSAAGKYRNCMRLSHASVFTPRTEWAVRRIGEAIGEMLRTHH
ncbi:PLP-dependent aminotransferase family protein [Castellaniella defragrans]|uniref:aminotransferase-like domain-containing protein n=1 Tax=Castellaniella defragrans TaxID=75697 RepID=UPI002AFF2C52|nr:PLP-dependent aminotransferase family protein [Castellaniella defragrans]